MVTQIDIKERTPEAKAAYLAGARAAYLASANLIELIFEEARPNVENSPELGKVLGKLHGTKETLRALAAAL